MKKNREKTDDTATVKGHEEKAPARTAEASYEVGYGKPPKHTQFVKGRSGNPRGRPKKKEKPPIRLSDAVSESFLEVEAYRTVTLRENGEAIELPVTQAVMRSLSTSAIKGNRLAQKYFLELVSHVEEVNRQTKIDRYLRLRNEKREGEARIEACRRRNVPPPDLLPHPDDIVLNSTTGEAYVNGPETKEDFEYLEQVVQLRDHLLLQSVHAEKTGRTPLLRHGDKKLCLYMAFAHLLDGTLPKRRRWEDIEAVSLMMTFQSLTKRERQRRVEHDSRMLKENWKTPAWMTPEIAEGLEQLRKQWPHGD